MSVSRGSGVVPVTETKPNSASIRSRIELTCVDMQRAFDELWQHSDLRRMFPSFLILLNQIMRASVPLMEAALAQSQRLAGSDPVAGSLVEYYEKHIDEERDHDVWTLNDLESIGLRSADILRLTPLPAVAQFVGSQYYWVQHHHPVALLGYIAVLEGSPPSVEHIERLKRVTGYPDDLLRTYAFHGRVDPHHTDDLNRALDAMPLTDWHRGLIGMSAAHSGAGLADCVRAVDVISMGVASLSAEA